MISEQKVFADDNRRMQTIYFGMGCFCPLQNFGSLWLPETQDTCATKNNFVFICDIFVGNWFSDDTFFDFHAQSAMAFICCISYEFACICRVMIIKPSFFSHSFPCTYCLETCSSLFSCDTSSQFSIHQTQNWNNAAIQMNDDAATYAVSFKKIVSNIWNNSYSVFTSGCISCFLFGNSHHHLPSHLPVHNHSHTPTFVHNGLQNLTYKNIILRWFSIPMQFLRKRYPAIFDCSKRVSSIP